MVPTQVRGELEAHVARVEQILAQHEVNVVMHNPAGGAASGGQMAAGGGGGEDGQHKVDLPRVRGALEVKVN